jgi:PPOX class probable F420-dependent enzyme
MLEERVAELLGGKNFATLTTLMRDGHPQSHVVWVHHDGEHVIVNTERERTKTRNVERDPRVTVTVWDAQNPYSFAEIRGRVVSVEGGDDARAQIDELAKKYMGVDEYPNPIQSERVTIKIAPERQFVH